MPVTVTTTVPAEAKVQESVDVPEPPVTVPGVRVHEELSDTRATLPVNPFTGEIATVEVPGEPTTTVTVAGLTVTVKSGCPVTVNVTVAEWLSEPLVPVTVTLTVPAAVKVHDKVDVPEPPATVVGVKVHAELLDARATLPVKLFTGEIVMVEVPGEPTETVTAVGLAAMVKSGRPVTV